MTVSFDVGPEGDWKPCGVRDATGRIETDALPLFDAFPPGRRTVVSMWRAPVGRYPCPGLPVDEVFMVRSGRATVTIDGAAHDISAGSVFRLPAGASFEFEVTEDFVKMAVSAR